jgi:hypothetical protein
LPTSWTPVAPHPAPTTSNQPIFPYDDDDDDGDLELYNNASGYVPYYILVFSNYLYIYYDVVAYLYITIHGDCCCVPIKMRTSDKFDSNENALRPGGLSLIS